MRILTGGTLVEDIDNYHRIHEMMNLFVSRDSKQNQAAEAFGYSWDYRNGTYVNTNSIPGNQSLTVLFKPLSGLLNQNKMLPVRYAPITIELELDDNALGPIVDPDLAASDLFDNENTSTDWQIENVQVKVDMCTLDNALDNSYAQHLLSGKSLPISYNTFVSQLQATPAGDKVLLNVSRALARLKSVFVTLQKDSANAYDRKFWNNFFSPMQPDCKDSLSHNSKGEFEFQLQIGSKLFPEYPIRSHNEAYYQLCKTLGVQASSVHNFDIDAKEYRTTKFVLGTDCEKVLDAGFTGINTRAGDLMSIRFNYNSTSSDSGSLNDRIADRLHIVLHSDQILEIRDSGCQVFD